MATRPGLLGNKNAAGPHKKAAVGAAVGGASGVGLVGAQAAKLRFDARRTIQTASKAKQAAATAGANAVAAQKTHRRALTIATKKGGYFLAPSNGVKVSAKRSERLAKIVDRAGDNSSKASRTLASTPSRNIVNSRVKSAVSVLRSTNVSKVAKVAAKAGAVGVIGGAALALAAGRKKDGNK